MTLGDVPATPLQPHKIKVGFKVTAKVEVKINVEVEVKVKGKVIEGRCTRMEGQLPSGSDSDG